MRIHVNHQGLKDLQRDLENAPAKLYREAREVIRDGVRVGRDEAQRLARVHAGRGHAKRYPSSMTADRNPQTYQGYGGGQIKASYGPEPIGQGLLAPILEDGTRNNRPQHNLDKSLDFIRPIFHDEIGKILDHILDRND